MIEHIFAAESQFRIRLQHVGNQIANVIADPGPVGFGELVHAGQDGIEEWFLLVVGRYEGREAA